MVTADGAYARNQAAHQAHQTEIYTKLRRQKDALERAQDDATRDSIKNYIAYLEAKLSGGFQR